MRVCINKSTGKLIESQSGGSTQKHLDTLLQNAINAGHKKEDVEVKFVTDEEFELLIEATKLPPTEEQLYEEKIQEKIREIAIRELEEEEKKLKE